MNETRAGRCEPWAPKRVRGVAALVLLTTVLLGACIHEPPPAQAYLRVAVEPPSASIYVDERYVGTGRALQKRPKPMRPGEKLITFKAPGYFPHDVRVDLPAGETTIEMKLRPIPN